MMQHCWRFKLNKGFILLPVVFTLAILAAVAYLLSREGAINAGNVNREQQHDAALYVAQAGYNHAIWQLNQANCTGYTNLSNVDFGTHSYSATITPTSGSPVSISATGTHANGASYSIIRDGVKIYKPMPPLIIQPDATAGKDTYIYEWKSTWNFGLSGELGADDDFADSTARSLLKFDLTGLPANVDILNATLELYQNSPSANGGAISVHRITSSWEEGIKKGGKGEANWTKSDTAISWATAGGDYDATAIATTTLAAGIVGWYSWELATLVQDWNDGKYPNEGFMLNPAPGASAYFDSSDSCDATFHPKLTITYSCECGVGCAETPFASCNVDYIPDNKLLEFNWDVGAIDIWDMDYLPAGTVINGTTLPASGGWVMIDSSNKHFYVTDAVGTALTDFPTPNNTPVGVSLIRSGTWNNHLAVSDPGDMAIYLIDLNGNTQGSFSTNGITQNPLGLSFIETSASGTFDGNIVITSDKDNTGASVGSVYIVDQAGVLQTSININTLTPEPHAVSHLPGTDKLLVVAKTNEAFIIGFDGTVYNQYDANTFGLSSLQGVTIDPLNCNHVIISKDSKTVGVLNLLGGTCTP